ncbi:MAG: phytanoyl-CoA dioxygenase family protein [Caulobacterales bacterium]
MTLSVEELATIKSAYERDGYVAVEGLLSPAEVEALKAEAGQIARGRRGDIVGAESADGRTDEEVIADALAIHFPHKLSPLVRQTMQHPAVVPILQALISPNVKAMQTMLFVKRAGKPGQAWHQDEHFIPTRDRSLCGAWIALDDATIENGCMWMHPGSHRRGVLYPMRPHGDDRFDSADEVFSHPYEREAGVAVELKAGGVAFFNGYVLHRSLPNRAPSGFRRALVTHYMSAESLLPWAFGTRTARPDVRDIVMIAGEDPYAWRGLEDLTTPYVRPEDPERAAVVYAEIAERRRAEIAARTSGGTNNNG